MNTTITTENIDMVLTKLRETTVRAKTAERENEILGGRVDELIHHLNVNEDKIKELVRRLTLADNENKDLTAKIERDGEAVRAVSKIKNEILALDGRIRDLRGIGQQMHKSVAFISSDIPKLQDYITRIFGDEDQKLAEAEAENE